MPVDHDQAIRERAYGIWERESRPQNRNLFHWLQAEAEIGTRNVVDVAAEERLVKLSRARRTGKQRSMNGAKVV